MRSCESIRGSLIDLHEGLTTLQEERRVREHLARCPACAARDADIGRLYASLRSREAFPREGEIDWDRFARATVARAVGRRWGVRRLVAALTRPITLRITPAWAGAASLVLLVGLTAAIYSMLPYLRVKGSGAAPARSAPARVLVPRENLEHLTVNLARKNTAQYLRETRAVLVTLLDVNIVCDRNKIDISAERAKATQLLRRQRLVAAELNQLPFSRAKLVTNDLQQLLLEISSLADCTRDENIQTLRDVVEKRQILMRMELLGQELTRGRGSYV